MPVGRCLRTILGVGSTSLAVVVAVSASAAEGIAPPSATGTPTAATVVVPDLFRMDPASAYRRLRGLGLRVAIPDGFEVGEQGLAEVQVTRQSPAGLSRVAAGTTVRLRVRCAPCAYLVDVAPPGSLRSAVVPDLIGRRISAAEYWVAHHVEAMVIHFGPLMRDAAPGLFGDYRIVHQHPAPGARLALGVRIGTGDRIVPTPLEITALQPA